MGSDVYILYADELIFINFCIDFICLFISLRLCDIKPKLLRLTAASLTGGIYSLSAAVGANNMLRAAVSVAVMCCMCFVSSGRISPKRFFRLCCTFFLTCAAAGGCISGIRSLFGASYYDITPAALLLSVLAATVAAAVYILFARSKLKKRIVEATIDTGVGKTDVTLLADSGNLAKEPMHGLPVIIMSPSVLPQALRTSPQGWPVEAVYIPIETASGRDVLCGFFPKEIKIGDRSVRACVALGRSTVYGGCDGIIPESII